MGWGWQESITLSPRTTFCLPEQPSVTLNAVKGLAVCSEQRSELIWANRGILRLRLRMTGKKTPRNDKCRVEIGYFGRSKPLPYKLNGRHCGCNGRSKPLPYKLNGRHCGVYGNIFRWGHCGLSGTPAPTVFRGQFVAGGNQLFIANLISCNFLHIIVLSAGGGLC